MLVTQPSPVGASKGTAPPEALPAWKDIVAPTGPFLEAVAERLRQQIQAFEGDVATFAEYALSNQGKQLRPVLVALSGGATGSTSDDHVLAAVIIEMVHLATLVHDDVMDEALIRRGRPTLAAHWGTEISVLLGDCLFAHALKLAAGFPTTEMCRAVAAATNTVCSGEILQTQRRRNFELSRAEYFQVIQMKTGELFALSCDLGAYLSGAGAVQRSALRQYGLAIGTAYQVYDDCLDLFGSETVVGKSLGTDLAKGKLTLPLLLALEGADPEERASIESMVRDWTPRYFPSLLGLLAQHGTLEGSREAVQQYVQAARQALTVLPESACRNSLAALCGYLGRQTAALGAA
ncbi:MAG TPA: polyprenyl synthetase family protein [Candidatus Saccharimonadales bacterium]|jgi:octaprenyl-diphosphate synthase|nr:polyprenyl synthetase family protein [Candidatus Saccharimonadales bacterium]